MSKLKINSEDFLKLIINKELEKHGVTYEQVKEIESWFIRYSFSTKEEYLAWKAFVMNVLTKQVTPKLSKKQAEINFNYIDLMWGLKCDFDPWERTGTSIEAI